MTSSPSIAETVEEVRDTRMDGCPVQPLGHLGGTYYFLSPIGEKRALRPQDFTLNGMVSLFEGDMSWLEMNFGRTNRKGEAIDGYIVTDAMACLVSSCRAKGLFNPNTPVRGVGVWRHGGFEDSRAGIIVHAGDTLLINGKWEAAGKMIGDVIYPAAPKIARVGDRPSTREDGEFLLRTVRKWNFKRPDLDPLLWVGFAAQAALGGAPRWRAHMYVNGSKGSGKSLLADVMACVLGAGAFDIKNNFTEAFLRQSMSGEARCLVLDEAENEPGGGRVGKVIELLRHMSTKDGAKTGRGSAGGIATSANVTGCAYLSSVLHVPLQPTDKSRITLLKVLPVENSKPEDLTQLEEDIIALRKISPAFRRRMIDNWARFVEVFSIYRAAFMKQGMDSRGADQPATLFAGAWVMLHDGHPCSDFIDEHIELAQAMMTDTKDDEEDGEGQQCLNHLYSAFTENVRNGNRMTVGQLLIEAEANNDNKSIGPYGLRLETINGVQELVIATRAVGLEKIFNNTRWAGGAWVQALEFIGAKTTGKPHRFAGAPARGYAISKEYWPKEGDV